MKNKNKITPLNQNILIRKLTKVGDEEIVGGIVMPVGVNKDVVERAVIVAISPELHLVGDHTPAAKVGDTILIQRHLNGLPLDLDGVEHMMIGYAALVAIA